MTPAGPSEGPSLATADVIGRVDAGESWLLDVREEVEWQDGHAPAAHHIPMGELGARLHEVPADTHLFVICHSGARSRLVTNALVDAGYPASNVEGGMEAWRAAGGTVVRDTPGAAHAR